MKKTILLLALNTAFGAVAVDEHARDFGIALPAGSKKIGEHRYQSSRSYEDTKREFHQRFLQSAFIKLIGADIHLPHVRTISYKNTDPHGKFYAINIYQNMLLQLTEIFFVENFTVDKEKT